MSSSANPQSAGVFAPGQRLLSERFVVEKFLGEDPLGAKHQARETRTGVLVSITALRPEIASSPSSIASLRGQLSILRDQNHPLIVHPIGLELEGSSYLLVEEFLRGATLLALLQARGSLSIAETLPLLNQLAESLDAASALGLHGGGLRLTRAQLHFPEQMEAADWSPPFQYPISRWPKHTLKFQGLSADTGAEGTFAGFFGGTIYRLLGGNPGSVQSANYVPLPSLTEQGNVALRSYLGRLPSEIKAREVLEAICKAEGLPLPSARSRSPSSPGSSVLSLGGLPDLSDARQRLIEKQRRLEEERREYERLQAELAQQEVLEKERQALDKARQEQELLTRTQEERLKREKEEIAAQWTKIEQQRQALLVEENKRAEEEEHRQHLFAQKLAELESDWRMRKQEQDARLRDELSKLEHARAGRLEEERQQAAELERERQVLEEQQVKFEAAQAQMKREAEERLRIGLRETEAQQRELAEDRLRLDEERQALQRNFQAFTERERASQERADELRGREQAMEKRLAEHRHLQQQEAEAFAERRQALTLESASEPEEITPRVVEDPPSAVLPATKALPSSTQERPGRKRKSAKGLIGAMAAVLMLGGGAALMFNQKDGVQNPEPAAVLSLEDQAKTHLTKGDWARVVELSLGHEELKSSCQEALVGWWNEPAEKWPTTVQALAWPEWQKQLSEDAMAKRLVEFVAKEDWSMVEKLLGLHTEARFGDTKSWAGPFMRDKLKSLRELPILPEPTETQTRALTFLSSQEVEGVKQVQDQWAQNRTIRTNLEVCRQAFEKKNWLEASNILAESGAMTKTMLELRGQKWKDLLIAERGKIAPQHEPSFRAVVGVFLKHGIEDAKLALEPEKDPLDEFKEALEKQAWARIVTTHGAASKKDAIETVSQLSSNAPRLLQSLRSEAERVFALGRPGSVLPEEQAQVFALLKNTKLTPAPSWETSAKGLAREISLFESAVGGEAEIVATLELAKPSAEVGKRVLGPRALIWLKGWNPEALSGAQTKLLAYLALWKIEGAAALQSELRTKKALEEKSLARAGIAEVVEGKDWSKLESLLDEYRQKYPETASTDLSAPAAKILANLRANKEEMSETNRSLLDTLVALDAPGASELKGELGAAARKASELGARAAVEREKASLTDASRRKDWASMRAALARLEKLSPGTAKAELSPSLTYAVSEWARDPSRMAEQDRTLLVSLAKWEIPGASELRRSLEDASRETRGRQLIASASKAATSRQWKTLQATIAEYEKTYGSAAESFASTAKACVDYWRALKPPVSVSSYEKTLCSTFRGWNIRGAEEAWQALNAKPLEVKPVEPKPEPPKPALTGLAFYREEARKKPNSEEVVLKYCRAALAEKSTADLESGAILLLRLGSVDEGFSTLNGVFQDKGKLSRATLGLIPAEFSRSSNSAARLGWYGIWQIQGIPPERKDEAAGLAKLKAAARKGHKISREMCVKAGQKW